MPMIPLKFMETEVVLVKWQNPGRNDRSESKPRTYVQISDKKREKQGALSS